MMEIGEVQSDSLTTWALCSLDIWEQTSALVASLPPPPSARALTQLPAWQKVPLPRPLESQGSPRQSGPGEYMDV